jgi:biopolymer transport protein ExbB/TolQ
MGREEERRMTFIVIPHGGRADMSTRSWEVSYRALRRAVIAGVVVGVLLFLMAVSWVWVAAQAARVPSLRREVALLERERQEREQLARTLARMQVQYEQIRTMLRGELPPLDTTARRDTAAADTAGAGDTSGGEQ